MSITQPLPRWSIAPRSTVANSSVAPSANFAKTVDRGIARVRPTRLLDSFMAALDTGDLDTLTTVLAEDVQLWSDGGGKVAAATQPLAGRKNVSAFFQGLNAQRPDDMRLVRAEMNRAPAWLIFAGHDPQVVFDFLVIDQRIVEIRAVRNPDKLRHLTGQV